jgi:hypothetical protein
MDGMSMMYTKNGRPLTRHGDDLFSRSGKHVGRIRGTRVYDPTGRYAGTVVGDRVIYRSTDSATVSGPFAQSARAGSAAANVVGIAAVGDEPPFPD